MESDIVSGQQSAWVLLKKLGEGDAGEVYLVESLLEKRAAILKRPVRSAFASDIIRQTSQIATEGKILKALSTALKMDEDFSVSVPELLDQSKPGAAYGERLFIVIETARGFDLAFLARTAQLGMMSGAEVQAGSPEEKRFLQTLAESGKMPVRVVLSALRTLLGLFERIHQRAFDVDGMEAHGILWNDVKPEHLFWDPWRTRLTVIDWGNSQFLERDGATRDRRYSAGEDYRQLIEEMGRFLETASPALYARLEWPERGTFQAVDPSTAQALQERIWEALQEQLFGLREAREREVELLRRGVIEAPQQNPLHVLEEIHRYIIGYGELPDYTGAFNLAINYAAHYAETSQFGEVQEICDWAVGLPGSDSDHLHLISHLAQIISRAQTATTSQRSSLGQAIQAALKRDWPTVLWNLVQAQANGPQPDWWYDLINAIRRQQLSAEIGDVQPVLVARRTQHTLQSMAGRLEQGQKSADPRTLATVQDLARRLSEDIIPNWMSIDPNPPHSNLTYQEIDEVLDDIGALLPEARHALDRALVQPRVQVRGVLSDWSRGEFASASAGLRHILLWDPERKRVLRAEQALHQAPLWLEKVQRGPQPGEHYQTFITDIEYEGRELRNQIGPAGWLDLILEGCAQLRRGAWPPDLFTSLPLLVKEMPWLRRFERRERLPDLALDGDAPQPEPPAFSLLNGSTRGKLGIEQDLQLTAALDAWVPEARGSSARVFAGLLRDAVNKPYAVAIKFMRMDKVDYSLPLFKEEVLVLNAMRGVPGVTPLLECGFVLLEDGGVLPTERESKVNPMLTGTVIRLGPDIGQEYCNQIEARIKEGWTPYLALELRDWHENLLALCDAGMTHGTYRPVADLLLMSIQICEILQEAHNRNIVYRDHKILHYYWDEAVHGIFSIDWNVAKLHPDGLKPVEKQMDLVQFGARGLHHILTGRTAPGALPLGPTRPDEIEQAAKSYQAQWTYDDQRLPEDLRAILERVLAGDYNNAIQLRDDLKQSFLNLPDV
ncbi:MAG TPA: serine/threonine-protein kinase [Anaerolineaceae bacterium]